MFTIVSTSERPDLVPVTVQWRWDAFFSDAGQPFDEFLDEAHQVAAQALPMPRTLVLLADGEPVGTASLAAADLEERPDLTPWLAGVFIAPHARRRGYAARLVAAVEDEAARAGFATLWLYTRTAERIYARIGWRTVERLEHNGHTVALMRRTLGSESAS